MRHAGLHAPLGDGPGLPSRSNSDQQAPRASPLRTAVRIRNSNSSLTIGPALSVPRRPAMNSGTFCQGNAAKCSCPFGQLWQAFEDTAHRVLTGAVTLGCHSIQYGANALADATGRLRLLQPVDWQGARPLG